jgi:uncharacterized repeat protein (TIGR03803 family)
MKRICRLITLAGFVLALATAAVQAQTYTDLYDFGANSKQPADPVYSGIIAQGRDGNLYSTTPAGGTNGYGSVFKITPEGKLNVIYNFDGSLGIPYSGLTLGTDGNLYGATLGGRNSSYGDVFKITPSGNVTVLHTFTGTDGGDPLVPPIQGADGNFYGTTASGGPSFAGTVYRITPSGKFTRLHSFDFTDGANPFAPLVQGVDGDFYGTTFDGGTHQQGTVFRITSEGRFSVLYAFDFIPTASSFAPLVQGADGNFYGTTSSGGTRGEGTVFRITSTGKLTVLHSFPVSSSDGANPDVGLVLATDGNLYGTAAAGGTNGYGIIYRITPKGKYSVIYNFDNTHGSNPQVTLLQHTMGALFGDTYEGGTYNQGVFYSLNAGLGAFAALVPTSGKVGKSIGILGQGFNGTTAVSFNGTSAQFKIAYDTFLTATVPNGATTGFVTVTTVGGNLVSNQKFLVTP